MKLAEFSVLAYLLLLSQSLDAKGIGEFRKMQTLDLAKFLKRLLKETAIFKSGSGGLAVGSLTSGECSDEVSWCSDYSHYCGHDTVNMYCKKTCNVCESCQDIHDSCSDGVKWGYCKGSEYEIDFMKKHCKKSCGFCENSKLTCEDKQTKGYCQQIKRMNQCNNPKYVEHFKSYCAETCGFCKPQCGYSAVQNADGIKPGVIVGGKTAGKGYYPWQVAIYHNDKFLCGGSLLSKVKVVTAAHCFNHRSLEVQEYKIVLGEHNRESPEDTEQKFGVKKIVVHEQYHYDADDHDIAIMILAEEASFSDFIAPICLAEENAVLEPGNRKCVVTGWGKTYHIGKVVNILQEVAMPIADRKICEKRNSFNNHKVTENMICGGYNDGFNYISACHGDSGGPLQCADSDDHWKLYGVVSWGSPLCNGLDRYTVFTRISKYIQWVNDRN